MDEQEVVEVCRVGPQNGLAPCDASLSDVSVKTDAGATVAVDVFGCAWRPAGMVSLIQLLKCLWPCG